MTGIQGHCDPRFEGVRSAFERNFERGLDVGASAAVALNGELVVDLWGGYADQARQTPWQRDTLTNVWSTTKTMTALSALLLADRGELDLHAPVARYWPEFAAAGKSKIEVRHLLGHTAGLAGWTEPIQPEDWADWEKCTSLLAAQEPWWEPGTASGYHGITQGYLVGEVVRRITGLSLGTFFSQELAGALGADFHIGLSAEHDERVSPIIPPAETVAMEVDPDSIPARMMSNPPLTPDVANQTWWRRCEIPAANGHGNARSVALVQSALACGEVAGRTFLSNAGRERVLEQQSDGVDLVIGLPVRFAMGYALNCPDGLPVELNERSCFWGGWGGSLVTVDLGARMVVAYVMNQMRADALVGDDRGVSILRAAYAALDSAGAPK